MFDTLIMQLVKVDLVSTGDDLPEELRLASVSSFKSLLKTYICVVGFLFFFSF